MNLREAIGLLANGEATIRELRGISDEELLAGVQAGIKLLQAGETEAATEVLSGLALYDPYSPAVWNALAEVFRQERCPRIAELFSDLARFMAN